MKIIQTINQHIPIWSMLCGDHGLKNQVDLINPKLLNEPDLLSPIENELRFEIFKSKRNWIARRMGERVSFGLIQVSTKDLSKYNTCFSGIAFDKYVKEYKKSFYRRRDYKIDSLTKTKEDIEKEYDFMLKMEENYINVSESEVTDTSIKNHEDISVALNRSIIMKDGSNYTIMDGTHRLSAYYWSRHLEKLDILPQNLYAFYFEACY